MIKNRAFILFSLIAILISLGLYFSQASPSAIDLAGDQHDIANMCVAYDAPELFKNDPYLEDHSIFDFYHPEFLSLLRYMKGFVGDYPAAFATLIAPTVLIFLLGMYLLVHKLSGSNLLSVCFSLCLLIVHIPMPIGGDWTLIHPFSMMLKNIYAAFVPWFIYCALLVNEKPKLWPLVGLLLGLSFYIHQASAPGWGISIWFTLLITASNLPFLTRLKYGAITAVAAAVVTIPGVLRYLGSMQSDTNIDFETFRSMAAYQINPNYFDVITALKSHLNFALEYGHIALVWLLPLFLLVVLVRRTKINLNAKFTLILFLILFAFTIGFTYADQQIAKKLDRFPLFVDMIRNMRYWPFALLILAAGFKKELEELNLSRFKSKLGSLSTFSAFHLVIITFAVALYNIKDISADSAFKRYSLLKNYRVPNKIEYELAFRESTASVLDVIKERTNEGDVFWGPEWLRYTTHRPVIWTLKDGGVLLYSDYKKATKWWERAQEVIKVDNTRIRRSEQIAKLLKLLKSWDVKYALFSKVYYPKLPEELSREDIILSNIYWYLVKIPS